MVAFFFPPFDKVQVLAGNQQAINKALEELHLKVEFHATTKISTTQTLTTTTTKSTTTVTTTETVVIPGSSDWQRVHSHLSFGTGTMDASAEGSARTVATFAGDFELTATVTAEVDWVFGCYAAEEDETFANVYGNGKLHAMAVSYFYNGGDDTLFYGGASQGSGGTWASSGTPDTMGIKRVGTTVTFMKNKRALKVFSQTSSVTLRIMFGGGGGTTNIDGIQWVGGKR